MSQFLKKGDLDITVDLMLHQKNLYNRDFQNITDNGFSDWVLDQSPHFGRNGDYVYPSKYLSCC